MLIPDNQRTTENINKNIYDNIRNTFSNYASRWNAIWHIWRDNSPAWEGNWVRGFKGGKIQMHDIIPENLRQTKTKAYEGIAGEVNPSIMVESNKIHTIGNENYIRGSLNTFNKTLIEKFTEGEYNSAGGFLSYKIIKSYGVNYQHYNLVGDLIEEQKYYVKEYERFDDEYQITLYSDEDCTIQVLKTKIIKWENENKYVVKWSGDRYYKTITINPYQRLGDKSYSCPTLSANNSNGVIVSNAELGADTYKLFNGVSNYLQFRKNVTEANPIIVYFKISQSFKLTQYTIISDSNGSGREYPIDWKIQGSNDNSNWITIDTKNNQVFSKGETKTFTLTSPDYYLYYRYVVTKYNNTGYSMELRRFTFNGLVPNVVPNYSIMQPYNIGKQTSVNVSSKGVLKDSQIESSTNNYNKFSSINYIDNDSKIEDNQENIYTYNVSKNWSLNNLEENIRQDNLVKKEDYEQLNRLLNKINSILKLRDGWFSSNGRCNYSCQVNCQNKCQLSCQACNTKQCHNQKCGTH